MSTVSRRPPDELTLAGTLMIPPESSETFWTKWLNTRRGHQRPMHSSAGCENELAELEGKCSFQFCFGMLLLKFVLIPRTGYSVMNRCVSSMQVLAR